MFIFCLTYKGKYYKIVFIYFGKGIIIFMENGMQKKFGLFTAISMVVGIVIGSGVFFKAVKVLNVTGGSMAKSLLVIAIVGLICIICSCVFATMGTKYVKCNGICSTTLRWLSDPNLLML